MAEPYRAQLGQQSAPLSGASAEAFGAAVGRGLEEAGATIDRTIHQQRERDRDLQAADAGVELANAATELDRLAIDARASAAPGGEGHTDAIAKAIEERQMAALGRIRDPHIRAAFSQRWAQLKDNIETREYGWQAGARVDKLAADVDTTGTTLATGQASNPNAAGLELSLSTIETSINAMTLPADLKTKLVREQQRKIVLGWANAMQVKDPHTLNAALDKGLLSTYLEGNDVTTLRDGALVEIRRSEAAARADEARAEATARESISTLLNKVGDGYVPMDAEWSAATALAERYKLDGKEWDLGVARDKATVNREYRDATPAAIRHDINALEAKGDKRTAAESVRLQHLKEAAPGLISRFESDPFAAAAAAGDPAPPLDLSNPKAVEQRVTWARSYAHSAGLVDVPYLSVDEIKAFQDTARTGPAGQLEVASTVRQAFGTAAATAIVRQIDPNNKDMQVMVGLLPRVAELYKRGVDARKRLPHLTGADAEDAAELRSVFSEFNNAIPVDLRTPIYNAALNIMAGRADEAGRTELTGDELRDQFRQFVSIAGGKLGTNSGTGGFTRWYSYDGSPGYAWLPQSLSERDFAVRMKRAGKADWIRAGGGAPYYLGGDGKLAKLTDAQIGHLSEYQLESVNPGLYRMTGPDGGHIVDANGRPWTFDIRKLAR